MSKFKETVKAKLMFMYGVEPETDEDKQHNTNLSIMIDCYLEDNPTVAGTSGFAEFASDPKNLQRFIDHGAKIL